MRKSGLLIERQRGELTYYEAKEGLTIDEVLKALPSDAAEQELLRLNRSNSESMYLIRCAALCSNNFGVAEVVYGTKILLTRSCLVWKKLRSCSLP